MRTLSIAKRPGAVTIAIVRGNDGRFSYCPQPAIDMLKLRQQPGEFDTVQRALDAVTRDDSIPTGASIVIDQRPGPDVALMLRDAAQAVVDSWGSAAATERTVIALAQFLESLPARPEAQFTDTEDPENPLGLTKLLRANADDVEFCAWARGAKIGDQYTVGGGAAAEYQMRGVS